MVEYAKKTYFFHCFLFILEMTILEWFLVKYSIGTLKVTLKVTSSIDCMNLWDLIIVQLT